MLLDIPGIVRGPQSFLRVPLQQLGEDALALLGDILGERQFLMLYVFKQSLFVEAVVGRHPFQQFVDEHSKQVPVKRKPVPFPEIAKHKYLKSISGAK